jgi:DNA-nicking Smr family endonuclease
LTPNETLDLHGFRHKEALELVQDTLQSLDRQGSFSLTIITGNSTVLQQRIFEEILQQTPYHYYIPGWNLGQIVVSHTQW